MGLPDPELIFRISNALFDVSQAAQDNGFDNDIEYWDSILPNQKVETIES